MLKNTEDHADAQYSVAKIEICFEKSKLFICFLLSKYHF